MTLLEIQSRRADRSLPRFDLQTLNGMEPSRYGESVRSLQSAEYIELAGEGVDVVVWLTESGERVAQLARPA